jgi:hypothetical protein
LVELSAFMMCLNMLSAIMLNVIKLCDVAPL